MSEFAAQLKREWKVYMMAIWMIGVTGFLVYLNTVVQDVRQTCVKLSSDVDSIESILISTDGNVAEMKNKIDAMSARIAVIHKRVRRR